MVAGVESQWLVNCRIIVQSRHGYLQRIVFTFRAHAHIVETRRLLTSALLINRRRLRQALSMMMPIPLQDLNDRSNRRLTAAR